MSDINVVIITGRITRDAELKYLPSGTAITNFGLASNRIWFKNGTRQEDTTFVDVDMWGQRAEKLAQYLTKGKKISVEGRLKFDKWEGNNNVKRSKLSIVAGQISFLESLHSKSSTEDTEQEQEIDFVESEF